MIEMTRSMASHLFVFVETLINFYIREFINFIREIIHTYRE